MSDLLKELTDAFLILKPISYQREAKGIIDKHLETLQKENEELKEAAKEWEQNSDDFEKLYDRFKKETEELKAQLAEAEKVIKYCISHYECDGTEFGIEPLTEMDTIKIAREYLARGENSGFARNNIKG